jgi:4-amino-4-deoxy-L-arabinose transferase-like glycosyltransferase
MNYKRIRIIIKGIKQSRKAGNLTTRKPGENNLLSKPEEPHALKLNKRLRWLTIFSIIEAVITLIILFSIPPDPKNALLFGYSWKRWLIFLATFLISATLINLFLKPQKLANQLKKVLSIGFVPRWLEITGITCALLLWVVFWLPAERLGEMADDYTRLKPLITLFFLLWVQLYVFLQLTIRPGRLQLEIHKLTGIRKQILVAISSTVFLGFVFIVLNKTQLTMGSNSYFPPPSSILSALQIFSIWSLFFGLQLISGKLSMKRLTEKKWILLGAALIWLCAFLIWNTTPIVCSNDRPGPDLPNMQCYPPIDDAVYSIGSHYIRLGEGVHNQWSTDKPFLLIVLALGQAIFGPNIDQYLMFQIILIALIPALLFIIGNWFTGVAGGILIAGLSILKGVNEIALYRAVAGMNVKIENTEYMMALILIMLAFSLFRWVKAPENHKWAAITGGMLGLGILVRFNPIGIVPVIMVLMIAVNRKHLRSGLIGLVLFGAALMLTTLPWFLTARDVQGNSYYWIKIQDVLSSRYLGAQATAIAIPENTQVVPGPTPVKPAVTPITGEEPVAQSPGETPGHEPPSNRMENIVLHFINNEFSAIAELPINYSFDKRSTITKQALWDMQTMKPLWLAGLSFENQFMLVINLLLIILGILVAWQKLGISGLVPLAIQTGYFLGNAAAMTSSERYLQPVNWVTLIYYVLALIAISFWLFRFLLPDKFSGVINADQLNSGDSAKNSNKHKVREINIILCICLVVGFIPYGVNFLPKILPPESSAKTTAVAFESISKHTTITDSQWQTFLNSDGAVVVSGKAFHPRYYQSNNYFPGGTIFEIMLLGKDFVYVSHSLNTEPHTYFSDDSDVILAGCILRSDEIWGSKRKIMQTFAVIQQDHEQQVYIDPAASWICQNQ